jgi:hypothetical protein
LRGQAGAVDNRPVSAASDWLRFELTAHGLAGVGCLVYGAVLLRRRERASLHVRLGVFLLVLGVAMTARAGVWLGGPGALGRVMQATFGLFPLPLALFFEALTKRSLHLPAKLVLLLGTAVLVPAGLLVDAPRWLGLALVSYHSLAVAYLGLIAAAAYRAAAPGPERSLHGATVLVCAASVAFMATDWLAPLGVTGPRLGWVPTVMLLYYGSASMHAVGSFELARHTGRLALAALNALAIGAVVDGVRAGRWFQPEALLVAGVLLLTFLIVEPLRNVLARSRAQRIDLLIDRLSNLPVDSRAAALAAIAVWPEVERVQLVAIAGLDLASPPDVTAYLEGNGGVVTRASLREHATQALDRPTLFVIDQLRFVLDTLEADHVALVGVDHLVAARFAMGVEPQVYRQVLGVLAAVLRHTPDARPAEVRG